LFSTMGITRAESSNSIAVSSLYRGSQAYRDFYNAYQGESEDVKIIRTRFNFGIDYFGSRTSFKSLYDYLKDRKEDYPTASNFIYIDNINQMGI
jgi:hypothetical protein